MKPTISRRGILTGLGALGACAGLSSLQGARHAAAQGVPGRKYLFALTAFGGAGVIDSFLPIAASTSTKAATLTTYEDSLIETVGDLRCVKPLVDEARLSPANPPVNYAQRSFLEHHGADVAVLTMEATSVSHPTAQTRALNGGGSADRGRTILETVAEVHGQGLPLPVINMASRGFAVSGSDPALGSNLRQVGIVDPRSFALGTHSSDGIVRPIDDTLVRRARLARDKAEAASLFGSTHGTTHTLRRWAELKNRGAQVEAADLVEKLLLVDLPGLPASAEIELVREQLPSLAYDVMEAEAALAFLLAKNGVSSSICFGSLNMATRELVDGEVTPFVYPNEGFDASHTSHRVAQTSCWSRVLRVGDGLIRLLKQTEDPRRPGTSMWDHSLLFFPTDFGRDKARQEGKTAYGTGHHLNNGVVMVSPLIRGGRVYGGVDPETALTYGFDRNTGEPAPGTVMHEEDIFGALAHALGVSFPGRRDMPALVR